MNINKVKVIEKLRDEMAKYTINFLEKEFISPKYLKSFLNSINNDDVYAYVLQTPESTIVLKYQVPSFSSDETHRLIQEEYRKLSGNIDFPKLIRRFEDVEKGKDGIILLDSSDSYFRKYNLLFYGNKIMEVSTPNSSMYYGEKNSNTKHMLKKLGENAIGRVSFHEQYDYLDFAKYSKPEIAKEIFRMYEDLYGILGKYYLIEKIFGRVGAILTFREDFNRIKDDVYNLVKDKTEYYEVAGGAAIREYILYTLASRIMNDAEKYLKGEKPFWYGLIYILNKNGLLKYLDHNVFDTDSYSLPLRNLYKNRDEILEKMRVYERIWA